MISISACLFVYININLVVSFFHLNSISNFVPEKVFFRRIPLHCFNITKSSAESHLLLQVHGEYVLAERTCQKWFTRCKNGDFELADDDRPGRPKELRNIAKHKQNSQNLWKSHKQSFPNVLKWPVAFKSKEIGCYMNWSEETSKDASDFDW